MKDHNWFCIDRLWRAHPEVDAAFKRLMGGVPIEKPS